MGFGVCIASLGYECYGSYALNLAMSLKAVDHNIQIALLYDHQSTSHLSEEELSIFDFKILVKEDFKNSGYQIIKLLINEYTPFKYTIYMDADSMWLNKKPSWLFGELFGSKFKIGLAGEYLEKRPKNNYTFWGDPKSIMNYHKINYIPQTVSGFFYFEKCDYTNQIFQRALQIFNDEKAPAVKWGNGKADEYCFNVALAELHYKQEVFDVFYFDKLHGRFNASNVYELFWGFAMGGHRVKKDIVEIYNRLAERNSQLFGFKVYYHTDKADIIKERIKS